MVKGSISKLKTWGLILTKSGLTASELLATDANQNLQSLAVATYPSLAELAHVKGVTSALQTQLNAKQATISFGTGVETALGVNVGSAGAFVTFDGDAGTPSALVGTNITGTASGLTAGTVTNATLTTALTVDTGTVTLTGNVANTSVLTIGAGAVSVSGSNTGDQALPTRDSLGVDTDDTVTFAGVLLSGLTASEIVITDASKNLVSAAVATYPSLTELSYVKGVSSALQTQIDGKSPTAGNASLVTVGTITTGVWNGTDVPVSAGGTGLSTISALSIWLANSANTITEVTPGAGNSIRINAGGTAWEAYTPGGGAGDMVLADVQTVTGAKTFGTIGGTVGKFILAGSTSGSTILNAAAVAGTTTLTLPSATDTLVGKATTDTFTNKTFDADGTGNSITNIENADIKAAAAIAVDKLAALTASEIVITGAGGFLASAAVATYPSLTELTYLKGVTSAIQTQFTGKAATDQTFYIGTTQVAINRASAALTLEGITLTTPDIGTPSAGVLTNCTGLPEGGLLDNAVTLAKMAGGTDGNLITYDAAGDPAYVATGDAGEVLTSNGAGAAPTFQAAGGGGDLVVFASPGAGRLVGASLASVDNVFVVQYDDGANDYWESSIKIPPGASSIDSIKVIYRNLGSGARDIVITALFTTYDVVTAGSNCPKSSDFVNAGVFAASDVASSKTGIITITAAAYDALTITPNDILRFQLTRNGADVPDTYEATWNVIGVLFTFA